ncbi:MAG: DNA-binding NtrC family response regulator [Candidatus Azotimanducaceae bacterium]|jgi:DNA-binding NtrC family response regulator
MPNSKPLPRPSAKPPKASTAQPIPIAVITRARSLANALKSPDREVEIWRPGDAARPQEKGTAPRVVIVDTEFAEPALIGQLRKQQPLADIIVIKERATGVFVQQMLKSGVSEVAFTRSPDRLNTQIERVTGQQMLLPAIDDLSKLRQRTNRFEGMYSRSDVMWDIFSSVLKVAPTNATVMVTGETGTGKNQLARAIHNRSQVTGRFVTVNCASMQPDLIESELFGHKKGAFTGAHRDKVGLFQHAEDGTLLLDEVGDMPVDIQLNLLHVLQEQRIRPVGANTDVPVNARIIAATNTPLEELVESGEFREDLYYRLNVVRFEMPSLRERPEDILYLFGVLLSTIAKRYRVPRPKLDPKLIAALCGFDWPGNIRQLENVLEQMILKGDRSMLTVEDLSDVLPDRTTSISTAHSTANGALIIDTSLGLKETVEGKLVELERHYLDQVLTENRGRVIDSAAHAGISRRTLQRKMADYQLDKAQYKQE